MTVYSVYLVLLQLDLQILPHDIMQSNQNTPAATRPESIWLSDTYNTRLLSMLLNLIK
jgi:hypothetical protein